MPTPLALVLSLVLALGATSGQPGPVGALFGPVPVLDVIDGDTLILESNLGRRIIDPLSVPMDLRGLEIPNNQLTLADVPTPNADMQAINDFALTFNGYDAWPDKETYDDIVLTRRSDTLAELRTCLFHAQREAHWSGDYTDKDYVRELVAKVRACLARRG